MSTETVATPLTTQPITKQTKLAIIGSGPAGLTAAIYAGRALLQPIVISGLKPGGQLMDTTEVENFPGFPEGIMGPDLMTNMRKQAERFEVSFLGEDVQSISLESRPFVIKTTTAIIEAESVIIATGASPKYLDLENEKRLWGHGVSYCATCDGFFFRGKDIAVIGGGDSAMEEALFLTKFANKVYIIHRRDEFRASKIMQEKAKNNPKIEIMLNTIVNDIEGQETVSGLTLGNVESKEISHLPVEGVFVAIGHTPNSHFLSGEINTDDKGYVLIDEHYQSSVPGIFVAGDIHDHRYRQAVTAAGAGCAAALEAERFLTSGEHLN